MPAPLTDQQLAVWTADLNEITQAPWLVAGGEYGQPMIYVEYEGSGGRTAVRTLLSGAAATEADVQFMTRSPERIATLLAEVARLRADLADEKAAHAKTVDNMEIASESFTDTIYTLERRLHSVRIAAKAMQDQRDSLLAEVVKRRPVAPACSCRAEVVHQAGCAGGEQR